MRTTIFSTPLLEAQEVCRIAVETAGLEAIKIFNHLKENGYISSFKYEMSPYNSGYSIEFSVDFSFSEDNQMKLAEIKDTPLLNFVYGIHSISLSPQSFYNSDYAKNQDVTIGSRSINGFYKPFIIRESKDLVSMLTEFVEMNATYVKEVLS